MRAVRRAVLVIAAIATSVLITACESSLPKPLYVLEKAPPSYRKTPDGAILDNANVTLDAEGYRVDKNGVRMQEVDVPAKLANTGSNPVAGYYISSTGKTASGNVMAPSEGANAGVGTGPGSAYQIPSGELPPTGAATPQIPSVIQLNPGEAGPTKSP
jgi:hypothetical protein